MRCFGTLISRQAFILSELPVWKTLRTIASEPCLALISKFLSYRRAIESPIGMSSE